MSIIYEALKKTQKMREPSFEPVVMKSRRKFFSVKRISLLSIILMIVLASLIAVFFYLENRPEKPIPPKPFIQKLTLTGVFSSNQEKLAMINNRMLHMGDTIAGLKVVRIDYEGVILSNGEQSITLH